MLHHIDPARAVAGAGVMLLAATIVPLFPFRRAGHRFSVLLSLIACVMGEWGAVSTLVSGSTVEFELSRALPFDRLLVRLAPLSAFFLVPLFLVAFLSSVYSRGYLPAEKGPQGVKGTFFLGLFSAAMVFLLLGGNGAFFLMAWEVMALSAWFLLVSGDQDSELRRASTVYLFEIHGGTMALFVTFSLMAEGGESS